MKPLDAINGDEIVIKISQTDVPTIELVDLPGIQLFPSDLYEQTTQLVDSYLHADNTLVLCVVDATIPSLDSSIALKMVRDASKLGSTILALTKADLIRDEESMVEHIFERVLKRSEEMADLSALAGCVAVVNRLHLDKVSLLEAETAEQAIFSTMFEEPADAYAPQVIQQKLRSSTTTAQLIVKLDCLFSDHIIKSWLPSVLTSIREAASSVQDHVAELGPSPEELDTAQLLKYIVCQVQAKDICISLSDISIDVNFPQTTEGSKQCPLQHLDKVVAAQQLKWGSNAWVSAHNALHEAVIQAVQNVAVSNKYLLALEDAFGQAFSASSALKLERFQTFGSLVQQHLLPAVISKAMASCKASLEHMVHELFTHLCGASVPPEAFTSLSQRLRGCITQQIHASLLNMGEADMISSDFVLAEDDGSASARAALLEKFSKLQAAAGSINRLSGLPFSGSYASVVKATATPKGWQSALQEVSSASATASRESSFQWPITATEPTANGPALVETPAKPNEPAKLSQSPSETMSEGEKEVLGVKPLYVVHEPIDTPGVPRQSVSASTAKVAGCSKKKALKRQLLANAESSRRKVR